jgi:hypothetical protein
MWLLLTLAVGPQITSGPDSIERLRTTDAVIQAAIDDGRRRSPTFALLVDAIERSNLSVYVTRALTLPHRMEGCLVANATGSRHLRVLIVMGLGKDRTITVLAHELQHVREVLDAGGGNDQAAFDALFTRIGERQLGTPTERYETAAAHEVMALVSRELRAPRKPRKGHR